MYETDFRGYDPQIGRFSQLDPLADLNEGESPYSFADNNPILMVDPSGLAGDTTAHDSRVKPMKYNENVFGVSLLERKLKWQIEKRSYPRGGREQRCPFVDITVFDNKLRINNWCDTYFIIDPLTGKILEEGNAR